MKKVFVTIIAILLPLQASAQRQSATIDGINYNLYSSTKTAEIIEGSYSGNVIIPPQVTYNSVTYSVKKIGEDAFNGCSGLTSVTIPNSVISIGEDAFEDCSGLTSVTIGNSVTNIGESAFNGCSGLTSVTIPNSVTSIKRSAFSNCSCLTSITVEDGNMYYDSRNNCNAIIGKNNQLIVGCKNTIIPNDVTSIGSSAFNGCSVLTSITIPNSVTSIKSSAFWNCSNLTSITIPNSVTSIGSSAFYGTRWYNNQLDGLVYAGKVAYNYKGTKPNNILIKDGTLGIADNAFYGCNGIISVTIPNRESRGRFS